MISKWLIKQLIITSQQIPLFQARGSYSGLKTSSNSNNNKFEKSELEFNDYENFLSNLESFDFFQCIEQKTILDYGSGYGGRAVWLAKQAKFVEGVEIHSSVVDISKEFSASRRVQNVNFSLGSDQEVLFEDNHFDVVISFDVLEHVKHPNIILKELFRVLKPQGIAILIFTPYYGIFSHHLNYITLFPGLHWFFSPYKIIDSVNDLLESHPKFSNLQISKQPKPSKSFNGKRDCLPGLNGITKQEYIELINSIGFQIIEMKSTPILEKFPLLGNTGVAINRMLNRFPSLDEYFSHNLVSILKKN